MPCQLPPFLLCALGTAVPLALCFPDLDFSVVTASTLASSLPNLGIVVSDLVHAPATLRLYDCNAEYDIWEMAWTPQWKAWCCEHESRGCPPSTTSTGTTSTGTRTPSVTATGSTTSTRKATLTSTETATRTTSRTVVTSAETSSLESISTAESLPSSTTPYPITAASPTRATTSVPSQFVATQTLEQAKALTAIHPSTTTDASETETIRRSETPARQSPITTTTQPDLGCNTECEIMGEGATCQSRITWTEMHRTNKESAPCPAAHVVVMSQCASCGRCLFADVKCIHKTGVSKVLGRGTFMYKFEDTDKSAEKSPQAQWPQMLAPLALVLLGVSTCMSQPVAARVRRWRSSRRPNLRLMLRVAGDPSELGEE